MLSFDVNAGNVNAGNVNAGNMNAGDLRGLGQKPRTHVGIEVSSLMSPEPTGIGQYGRGVLGALQRTESHSPPWEYELVWPVGRWWRRDLAKSPGYPSRPYLSGRRLGRRLRLLYLLDTRLPHAYAGAIVATVFDVISAMEISAERTFSSPEFRAKKLCRYREIFARSRSIVTLSAAVRDEIERRFKPAGNVVVVPPGLRQPPAPLSDAGSAARLRPFGITEPFLLGVGALCPRKNIEAAVRAFAIARRRHPRLQLVLIGKPDFGWRGSAGARAVASCEGPVVQLGYVPGAVLWEAYRRAALLLHLSHYEGFGLTVLEALSVGTPVVASRRGGIPEAAGGAALLVDPDSAEEVDHAVELVLTGDADAHDRAARGPTHASRYTWDAVASQLERLFQASLAD